MALDNWQIRIELERSLIARKFGVWYKAHFTRRVATRQIWKERHVFGLEYVEVVN